MNISEERLTDRFLRLASLDSPSFDERAVADEVVRQLAALDIETSEDDGSRFGGTTGNLFAHIPGTLDLPPLLFCAHTDTVAPACGKKPLLHEDGRITSSGNTVLGADDAAGIACILEAAAAVRDLPHRPLELFFPAAEEPYTVGSRSFDCSRIRSRQAYVLDLSGAPGTAALSAPTILYLKLTLHGAAAHAGFAPEKGIHTMEAAAEALTCLKLGRIDERTTVNLCTMHAGTASNVIPETAVLEGEVRSMDHGTALAQAEHVRAVFESAIRKRGGSLDFITEERCRAYSVSENCSAAKRFQAAVEQLNLPLRFISTFGGSDNNTLAMYGIEGLVIANAMFSIHSCSEYTTVQDLYHCAELTRLLMLSED